jgi:hypothetical protein
MWLQMYYLNGQLLIVQVIERRTELQRLALRALGCFPLILKSINDHPGLNDIQNQTILLSDPRFSRTISTILFSIVQLPSDPPLD